MRSELPEVFLRTYVLHDLKKIQMASTFWQILLKKCQIGFLSAGFLIKYTNAYYDYLTDSFWLFPIYMIKNISLFYRTFLRLGECFKWFFEDDEIVFFSILVHKIIDIYLVHENTSLCVFLSWVQDLNLIKSSSFVCLKLWPTRLCLSAPNIHFRLALHL